MYGMAFGLYFHIGSLNGPSGNQSNGPNNESPGHEHCQLRGLAPGLGPRLRWPRLPGGAPATGFFQRPGIRDLPSKYPKSSEIMYIYMVI